MSLKALTALTVAAIFCGAPLAAQAHEGHHHPSAKVEKAKKPKVKRTRSSSASRCGWAYGR